jgi:cytochrome c-type biogenesis protein CcmH
MSLRHALGAFFVGVALALAHPAAAALDATAAVATSAVDEPDEPPRWAYQMAHDLMSPFCPGRTLAECTSPQADELRMWILLQAASGATYDEVEADLIGRFGDRILAAPRAEGWGLAAYALPIGGFVLGGGIVVVALRRLARSAAPVDVERDATTPAASSPEFASDAELERLVDEELSA